MHTYYGAGYFGISIIIKVDCLINYFNISTHKTLKAYSQYLKSILAVDTSITSIHIDLSNNKTMLLYNPSLPYCIDTASALFDHKVLLCEI